ncbi:hypothetical protein HR060_17810 [Catenovulum sp. SM1970]|uniref:hypothetical protein n=1 Tax=Marinifaba aquimaris TaxID=2741323 RepID=UPI001571EFB3|nr:hypothetical protein [Marinifaba aquimaris]NTS78702.1 hypothetical protein [Marinifaba aquimaris]
MNHQFNLGIIRAIQVVQVKMEEQKQALSIAQKQNLYLLDCLDFLKDADETFKNSAFHEFAIQLLTTGQKITSKQLINDELGINDPRAVSRYMKRFITKLEENKALLWQSISPQKEHLLNRFPMIKVEQGGGNGIPNKYFIEPEDIISKTQEVPLHEKNEVINPIYISYKAEKLKRTPWYIRVCSPFFEKYRSRLAFMLPLLLIAFLSPLALIALFTKGLIGMELLIIASVIESYILFIPAKKLSFLVKNKAVLIDEHIGQPLSAICLSEITKIHSSDNKDIERKLTTLVIKGRCPICYSHYGYDNSVILEYDRIFFPKRVIGKCLHNPIEHQFSFDKDLMSGKKLN